MSGFWLGFWIAIIIDAFAYKKHIINSKRLSGNGIVLSISAGILMALFYRFVAS